MSEDKISMPISAVELQEYLFAESLADVAEKCVEEKVNVVTWSSLKKQVRECFRFQRFAVMNWLLMNGVSIPERLLSDQAHRPVGQQLPDQSQVMW